MRVVPGTHHEQVPHEDTFDETNLLSRGQEIAVDVDPATVVDVELEPGEMSLHHVLLFHGSEPNRAEHPRIGFAIRYVATHVRQRSPIRESATLVRGTDSIWPFRARKPAGGRHAPGRSRTARRDHRSSAAHPLRGRRSSAASSARRRPNGAAAP